MNAYHITVYSILFILSAYFVVGFIGFAGEGREDIYPFFSWSLFITVPERVQEGYGVRIVQAGDKTFEPPVFLENADGVYATTTSAFPKRRYIQLGTQLGRSISQENRGRTRALRRQLEQRFTVHPVRYEIVQVRYDTIERWKTEAVKDATVLQTFSTNNTNGSTQ